jgi:predicted TIM-barrel fold metal-dependent hydrolase
LVTTPSIYGTDNRYSLEAVRKAPSRFRVVARVDPASTSQHEDLQRLIDQVGIVGVRVTLIGSAQQALLPSGLDRLLEAAGGYGLPVCIYAPGAHGPMLALARRFPETTIVVDHLGLPQPLTGDATSALSQLPEVHLLAEAPNVVIKLSALPVHSSQDYPFLDLAPHVASLVRAFGPHRIVWGSDITQHPNLSYSQAAGYLGRLGALDAGEMEAVMGANLRRTFRWERP